MELPTLAVDSNGHAHRPMETTPPFQPPSGVKKGSIISILAPPSTTPTSGKEKLSQDDGKSLSLVAPLSVLNLSHLLLQLRRKRAEFHRRNASWSHVTSFLRRRRPRPRPTPLSYLAMPPGSVQMVSMLLRKWPCPSSSLGRTGPRQPRCEYELAAASTLSPLPVCLRLQLHGLS